MYLIRRGYFSKLGMLKIATIGAGLTALPIVFIPSEYPLLSSAFLVISTFFGELGIIVYWALPSDCADFCELKFNKKMVGVLGAVALFSQKFAMSLVGIGIGGILSYVNYEPGGVVTEEIAMGILVIVAALPMVCHFVSYYFLAQYDLDEKEVRKIHLELAGMYEQAKGAGRGNIKENIRENTVISISRQFGSGGRELSRILAEKLSVHLFDRQIIHLAAEQLNIGNLSEANLRKLEGNMSQFSLEFMPFYAFGSHPIMIFLSQKQK